MKKLEYKFLRLFFIKSTMAVISEYWILPISASVNGWKKFTGGTQMQKSKESYNRNNEKIISTIFWQVISAE